MPENMPAPWRILPEGRLARVLGANRPGNPSTEEGRVMEQLGTYGDVGGRGGSGYLDVRKAVPGPDRAVEGTSLGRLVGVVTLLEQVVADLASRLEPVTWPDATESLPVVDLASLPRRTALAVIVDDLAGIHVSLCSLWQRLDL